MESAQNNALILIHQRNEFYRQKHYWALAIFLLSLVANILLILILIYLLKNPTHPYFFAADSVARLEKSVPLNQPNVSTQDMLAWTVQAVEAANNYDFINYRGQLQNSQKYFTDYGWRKFMDGLKLSNNLLAVTQRKYILMAKVVDTPKIIGQAVVDGAYSWKIKMPLLITALTPPGYGDQNKIQDAWVITVVVQRRNILQSTGGLGIAQYVGEVAH